eukprot:GHVL01011348.1.p1 GENE.GHVL01011348.1~~GHVL01011348.1.p1  ORF type:complete len:146 (+),score=60.13 GHVL01011348.1:155-592(+)
MVLPSGLIRSCRNQPILVELKNGETYTGILAASDCFMNLYMKNIVLTNIYGDEFIKISECYIRGNNIKFIQINDFIIQKLREESKSIRLGGGGGGGVGERENERGGGCGGERGGMGGRQSTRGGRQSTRGGRRGSKPSRMRGRDW